jgi:CubicO group peptidase (beta-lactamase class C family)
MVKWGQVTGRTASNAHWTVEGFTTPLVFAPGKGWRYGSGLDWAGMLLEKITGQRLSEYMAENIFKPLGMEDSTFYPKTLPQVKDRTATFAYRNPMDSTLVPGPSPVADEHPVESAGAGVYGTAKDYARFLQALLATLQDGGLLQKETAKQMIQPQLDDAQRAMLEYITSESVSPIAKDARQAYAPEFPLGLKIDHSFCGMMNTEDVPGKRKKGSVMWSGWAHSHWVSLANSLLTTISNFAQFLDPETGIAAVMITTLMASEQGDKAVNKLWHELEVAVYEELV